MHDWSETTKKALDVAAVSGAVVAGVSLANAALIMSIAAATISVILGCIRLYDRFTTGPAK